MNKRARVMVVTVLAESICVYSIFKDRKNFHHDRLTMSASEDLSLEPPSPKRARTGNGGCSPDIQCIALLQSNPQKRCSRAAVDVISGYCGVHRRQTDRQLFQTHTEDCAICLGAMKYKTRIPSYTTQLIPSNDPIHGRGVVRTNCTHIFHTRCLRRWMVCHNNLTCPMCRASILVDLKEFDSICYHQKLSMIYHHFPPPTPAYMFPSHLSSLLMMPSVVQALEMTDEQRAILIDIAFNCMFSSIFFRILRLNPDLLVS